MKWLILSFFTARPRSKPLLPLVRPGASKLVFLHHLIPLPQVPCRPFSRNQPAYSLHRSHGSQLKASHGSHLPNSEVQIPRLSLERWTWPSFHSFMSILLVLTPSTLSLLLKHFPAPSQLKAIPSVPFWDVLPLVHCKSGSNDGAQRDRPGPPMALFFRGVWITPYRSDVLVWMIPACLPQRNVSSTAASSSHPTLRGEHIL